MNKKRKILKKMFRYGGFHTQIIFVFIAIAIEIIVEFLYYPMFTKPILDKEIPNGNLKAIVCLSSMMILVIVLRFVYTYFTEKTRKKTLYQLDTILKRDIFNSIQTNKTQNMENRQVGELIEITTNQANEASRMFVWNYVGIFSVRILSCIMIALIVLFLDVQIGLVTIGIFLTAYLLLTPIYHKTYQVYQKIQTQILKIQSVINETIDSFTTIKTLRMEEINNQQIQNLLKECNCEIIKSKNMVTIHTIIFSILVFIATAAVLLIGGNKLAMGLTTASVIMLGVDYMEKMRRQIEMLFEHAHKANKRYSNFLSILELTEQEKETQGTKKLEKVDKIEYRDVSLSYDTENIVLRDINLVVDRPMKIALVGKSGSGKTSFINLLPRFYEITTGNILINDIGYETYKLSELRNHISYVFQEPIIFDMTILENILYGCSSSVTKKEVVEVCKKIGLHEKIQLLENGYDTNINHATNKLSFGEKQLLNFARAILKDADIMILDEVTSNLDLEFEDKVMKATKEILKNKFVFVIAHRLKTIKEADKILFIENGTIVEQGTHEELVNKQGCYYKQLVNVSTF